MDRKLRIYFYGGVDSVTGANFILEKLGENKTQIMVDCGIAQGHEIDPQNDINKEDFKYEPSQIDFLLVTHAHADHIGRIPKLVRDGFSGQIFSTPTTRELVEIMFDDALSIIENESRKNDIEPMYEKRDIEKALSLWQTVPYHVEHDLNDDFSLYFKDAGHILGSAMIYVKHKPTDENIVFTGDLGNTPTPLIRDTEIIDDADYLIMESVYGNRNHEGKEGRKEALKEILNKVIERKGTLLIPVFSLEKTQVLLHEMNDLIEGGEVKSVPVFFDSPLGIRLTAIYEKQFQNFNEKVQARIKAGDDIFDFPKLIKTFNAKDSEEIHKTEGPKIIIASSGMSVGGRILDHEKKYLPDPKNAILFIGYQAIGSIGRAIEEGHKSIEIEEEQISIKAQIYVVTGYSSHKDSDGLVDFVNNTKERLKKVFVVMGEKDSSEYLSKRLKDELNVNAVNPQQGKVYDL